jgi:hypothetical protein
MNTIVLNVGINGSIESMAKMDQSQQGVPNVKDRIGIDAISPKENGPRRRIKGYK